MQDIQGHLTVGVLAEFFAIWDLVQDIPLQPEVEDTHSWRLDSSGQFTSKLAYVALFNGSTEFRPNILIWRSPDPAQCVKPTALGTTFSLIFHLRAAAGVQAKEQNILMDETTQSHTVYFSS